MSKPNSFKLEPFYSPEESSGKEVIPLGKDGMIELLGEDDEKEDVIDLKDEKEDKEDEKEEKEDKENDEEETEEKDDLDELEDELKGTKEEDLELVTPLRAKEILAKYPKLWKDFPFLRNSYYRERAFTEIVPTVDDAKEAVDKAQVLDRFDADLKEGNLENALLAVKKAGEESFNKLVDNYLPNLYKADKDAYLHVVGNIVRQTTSNMLKDAKASGNAELKAAAEMVNEYIFRTKEAGEPVRLSKEGSSEEKKEDPVKKREEEFVRKQYETSKNELTTKVTNVIKSTIEANIDPKNSMTDYVKKNAIKECKEMVIQMLDSDSRLGILIDKLWEQAFKTNFSAESIAKIKSAYLSRAKTLMPSAIKKVRQEALRGSVRREKEEIEDEGTKEKTGHLPVGRSASSSNSGRKSVEEKAKEIPAGMSSRDFLMQD